MNLSTSEHLNASNAVRVRFAPSPTGYLHIGGARTALFNWLFARKMKGSFILRIEDTDEARSTEESVGAIIDSMKWLGLDWDEGPRLSGGQAGTENTKYGSYFQMQRKEAGIYQKYVDQLISEGKAYPCYCTPDEVEEMRKTAQAQKRSPKYDGRCFLLNPEERKKKEAEGRTAVIRFRMPAEGKVGLDDIVRGKVEFENTTLDDFVIMKASGVPTYNFACVVDDHLMEISHVIRGDDHLSNTPRQLHLYKALGWQTPIFAHLSMIMGPDGTRLSKRHGHTSVLEYRKDGYLSKPLINYLALLGWATEDSQTIFNVPDELIEKFQLERCAKSPAIFDQQKLLWMNGEYIRSASGSQAGYINEVFNDWLALTGQQDLVKGWDRQLLEKIIGVEAEKVKLLSDIPKLFDFFFVDKVEYTPEAVEKVLKKPEAKKVLELILSKLGAQEDFSPATLEKLARDMAAEIGIKAGQAFHPIRVAVSGRTVGPSLFHAMEWLGKEKVTQRIQDCLKKYF